MTGKEERTDTNPRVLIIGPSPRFLSGISYYTIRLANALSFRVQVTALLFRYMLPKRLFPGWRRVGADLVNLQFEKQVRVQEILDWFNPFTWAAAAREVRRSDLVILEWWTSSVAHMYLALLVISGHKTPVMIEFHEVVDPLEQGIPPIRIYSRMMGRLIRSRAQRYIVHSRHDRRLIAENYHIREDLISVIPHGLYDQYPVLEKEDARSSLGITDPVIILFFGLLRPYKGIKYLVRAFEQIPSSIQERSLLLIAGEGWEDSESLSLIAASPVRERIRLDNKYVSDDEIPSYFSAADLLVLPYTRASQSGVAHIGISYGLPIIASEVGGLVEGLEGYEGVTFVQPQDEDDLREAMVQVISSLKGLRHSAPDELKWDSVAERFVDEIYQSNGGR